MKTPRTTHLLSAAKVDALESCNPSVMFKRCSKCETVRPRPDFHGVKRLNSWCKFCVADHHKKRRSDIREYEREQRLVNPEPEKVVLLRVGKDFGDFHMHSWPASVIDKAWEAFKHMRELYPIMADLKKVAS